MESITLSTKTLQQILNYLATQPYNEVVNLINTIQVDIQNQPSKEEQRISQNNLADSLLDGLYFKESFKRY